VQKKIINEVLSVEDRAQKIIRDSERNARDIVTEAQAKANELVRSSLKDERDRQNAEIAQAEADMAAALAEYEASLGEGKTLSEAVVQQIAKRIVDRVVLTDFDLGGDSDDA
jgi:V/A-type H+-transporting ATPase subunit G/H